LKRYRPFIIAFAILLALYIVAELNRPKPIDWRVTLSKEDKNPYGSSILYQLLPELFPGASIESFRLPVYDQINNYADSNTAYLLLDPVLNLSKVDIDELLNYTVLGNYVFISSFDLGKRIADSLHLSINRRFTFKDGDSVRINFSNPKLHTNVDYWFNRLTIDEYFEKFDTSNVVILGNNQYKDVDFIKLRYGNGAFLIHANPLCFSNYFLLARNNADYVSTALSYIPQNVKKIYWDEYYKSGPAGSRSILRFILSNTYLRWAYRIFLFTMVIFVLFEIKRTQRIIPVITPLHNSTLEFVKTVGSVYFNQHNNKNIAEKKIQYLMDYIRTHFYLSTKYLDEEFIIDLARKTNIGEDEVRDLVNSLGAVYTNNRLSDSDLLIITRKIDLFYNNIK
jgi:hypothetical protein